MNNIPGLKIDVGFGSVNEKLPDWRKAKELGGSEQDPDDDQIETPEDVKAMLGFDPAEESKEDDMEQNRTTETLVMRWPATVAVRGAGRGWNLEPWRMPGRAKECGRVG